MVIVQGIPFNDKKCTLVSTVIKVKPMEKFSKIPRTSIIYIYYSWCVNCVNFTLKNEMKTEFYYIFILFISNFYLKHFK